METGNGWSLRVRLIAGGRKSVSQLADTCPQRRIQLRAVNKSELGEWAKGRLAACAEYSAHTTRAIYSFTAACLPDEATLLVSHSRRLSGKIGHVLKPAILEGQEVTSDFCFSGFPAC